MKSASITRAAAGFTAAAALSASVLAQSGAPSPKLLHSETAFNLVVRLPYADTAPLFGPEGERPWAGKHWDPQFLYPQPAHDEQGSVFTVQHGALTAVWVNTLLDLGAQHFIYAYFIPGIMVTTIDIRFASTDSTTTQVHVVYARTALTEEGNDHVAALTKSDKAAGHDWQEAIDTYLGVREPKQ